jgi:nucleotide-binding universal stress UspA family protein
VVVGVDGGPLSTTALAHAFDAAALLDVGLTAVHVWSDSDMQRRHLRRLFDLKPWDRMRDEEERVLAERLAGWSERYPGTTVHRVVEHDDPARSLVQHSSTAQLVVVATRGRGGFAGLTLGSTGLRLIQHADCPVMLVGPESASP